MSPSGETALGGVASRPPTGKVPGKCKESCELSISTTERKVLFCGLLDKCTSVCERRGVGMWFAVVFD